MKGKFNVKKLEKYLGITIICAFSIAGVSAITTKSGFSMTIGEKFKIGYAKPKKINDNKKDDLKSTIEKSIKDTIKHVKDNTESAVKITENVTENILQNTDNIVESVGNFTNDVVNAAEDITNSITDILDVEEYKIDDTKEYRVDGIDKIYIKALAAIDAPNVKVISSKEDKIKIHFHGSFKSSEGNKGPHLNTNIVGNKINVVIESYKHILYRYYSVDTKLDIYIPEKYFDNIDVEQNGLDFDGTWKFNDMNNWNIPAEDAWKIRDNMNRLKNMKGMFNSNMNNWNMSNNGSVKEYKVDEIKECTVKNINDIYINTVSSDVNIIPIKGEKAKVHYYGKISTSDEDNVPNLETNISGEKLNIKIKHKNNGFTRGYTSNNTKLDIFIPEKDFDNISINTVSGCINIEKLKQNKFKGNTCSGNIKIDDLTCKESTITTVSGKIDINYLKADKNFIQTCSGNVSIDNIKGDLQGHSVSGTFEVNYKELSNNISLGSTSGDVELNIPKNSEFKLRLRTLSGDFSNDFGLEFTKRKLSGTVETTVGSSKKSIVIETLSGDIELNN